MGTEEIVFSSHALNRFRTRAPEAGIVVEDDVETQILFLLREKGRRVAEERIKGGVKEIWVVKNLWFVWKNLGGYMVLVTVLFKEGHPLRGREKRRNGRRDMYYKVLRAARIRRDTKIQKEEARLQRCLKRYIPAYR